jgi:molybdopterin-guanine dinucleotide biosynthesis protein B
MLASPYRVAVVRELRGAQEPSLAEHLERLSPADLTLVEGYKWERVPKLEVYRPALGQPPLFLHDADVVAVASDAPRPDLLAPHVAWFDLNAPEEVLSWLNRRLTARS